MSFCWPLFIKKTYLWYRNPHNKPKTAWRPSQVYNGNPFINKTVSSYGMNAQVLKHYDDVIMGSMASQITSLTIVYSTVYSDADQRKHQSPASLAFVWGIHREPVNSPYRGPVTRKMSPFDDVIMNFLLFHVVISNNYNDSWAINILLQMIVK